eukprot:gene40682-12594_t
MFCSAFPIGRRKGCPHPSGGGRDYVPAVEQPPAASRWTGPAEWGCDPSAFPDAAELAAAAAALGRTGPAATEHR